MQKLNLIQEFKDIDASLEARLVEVNSVPERIRKIVKQIAPEAEDVISYGVPAFKYYGIVVYFAAFKNHCSLFTGGGDIMELFKEDLKYFKTSKGTIQLL